jgi:tetratricopeptide (TPR) repeat protein
MRPLRRCSVFAFVLLCSRLLFAGDPQWVEVRSPNFSVVTDAGEKKGREVAFHFEQMRGVFGTLITSANVNLPVPLQIVAFRNTKEMRQVAPLFRGKPTEMSGLFQSGEDRCFIMLDMSVENPWNVVFHEYAHRLMDGNTSIRTDPWFEEGFAEFFSSIEVDNKQARVGKIPEETYQILGQLGMMHVSDLFRVQQNSKVYNESGDHRTTFYAESSLVVHYLYDNNLIPKLAVYYQVLQDQKKPLDQATQAAFGMTPEQFDKVLRNYFSSGRFKYYAIPTPPSIAAAQFTASPVSPADARAVLADIHAHSPDYQSKALSEFQEVLATDPNNASALRGAGFAYLRQRDLQRAAEFLRRAAQLNSKDPRVHYYYAMLLSQEGMLDEEKSSQVKNELEQAIALDPKLTDAYSMLGYTQAFSGEPEKGLATLQKAVEMSPRNERYLSNLATVYMVNHKLDDAITIWRNLTASSDPEVASTASQQLAQAIDIKEWNKTYEWHVENRIVEGPQLKRPPGQPEVTGEVVPQLSIHGPSNTPVRFFKGKITIVDCSAAPQAVLTVLAGSKSIKVHIRDSAHVVVIGADQFSCDWKDTKVAVNYRERADGEGDVVSLEIQ